MVKVEYGDFYKFLSSLGVTIIGATLLLSWLFLREPFSWINQISQTSNLDNKTKIILEQKQSLLLSFMNCFNYFVVIALVVGLIFLIIGIVLWFRIQLEVDKNQRLTNQKIEKELQNMTPSEIVQSVIEDVVDTNSIVQDGGQTVELDNNNPISAEQVTQQDTSNIQANDSSSPMSSNQYINNLSIAQEYMGIETIVYNKLSSSFRDTNIVLRNQRIGRAEFDIIVQGNNPQQSDFIFEIKYFRNVRNTSTLTSRLRQASRQVLLLSEVYTNTTNRISVPIVLGIIASTNDIENATNIESYRNNVSRSFEQDGLQTTIILIQDEELEGMSSDEFIRLLSLENLVNVA